MTTLQKAIKDRLAADFLLTTDQPSGLGFTVWDRWLVKPGNFAKPEAGTTPEAFNAEAGGRMKRNIVVLDGGEVAAPGNQPGRDGRRWDSFPTTHIFCEAHANGKQAALDAYLRIETLLVGWEAVITGYQRVSFAPASRLSLEDSETWPGNIVVVARWRASGARRLVA